MTYYLSLYEYSSFLEPVGPEQVVYSTLTRSSANQTHFLFIEPIGDYQLTFRQEEGPRTDTPSSITIELLACEDKRENCTVQQTLTGNRDCFLYIHDTLSNHSYLTVSIH